LNKVEVTAGSVLAVFFIFVCVRTWLNYRKCSADLTKTSEELKDAQIREQVHAMSDSDLDAALDKDSGGGSKP